MEHVDVDHVPDGQLRDASRQPGLELAGGQVIVRLNASYNDNVEARYTFLY